MRGAILLHLREVVYGGARASGYVPIRFGPPGDPCIPFETLAAITSTYAAHQVDMNCGNSPR